MLKDVLAHSIKEAKPIPAKAPQIYSCGLAQTWPNFPHKIGHFL